MATVASKALHEQLSLIMAALTKAAVAEICEVVDEGYALLQLEISRRNQENEALRKKLHLIESIVIRGAGTSGGTGGGGARGKVAEPEVVTVAVAEIPPRRSGDGGGGAVLKEELPDVVLIKDEDSDSDDAFDEEHRTFTDGGPAVRSARNSCAGKRPRTGNDETENSSPSSTSSEHVSLKTSKLTSASQKTTAAVYALESPHREPGCSGQVGAEETESLCSYSSHMDPGVQAVQQQDYALVSPSSSRQTYFSSSSLMESPSNRVEVDFGLPWTKLSKGSTPLAQFQPNENMDSDAFGLKLISVSGSASTDGPLSEHSDSAFEYEDIDMLSFYREQSAQPGQPGGASTNPSRVKRFICPVCSKTYATAQNLDVHMRIHRGEKPFGCSQCSKKFTQSAHLKAHLSIHSGERPHACRLCPRSFIARYSLKLHMKKHHPEAGGAAP